MPRKNLRKTIFRDCMNELRLYDTYDGLGNLIQAASSDSEMETAVAKSIDHHTRRTSERTETQPTESDQAKEEGH